MNRRIRTAHHRPSQPTRPDGGYHRYLKPGALAQLRDSRISTARSHRSVLVSHSQISLYRPPSSPSPSSSPSLTTTPNNNNVIDQLQIVTTVLGGFPCFSSGAIYGPRCPQRKKIVSARSVYFNSASPVVSDSPDSIIDMFSTDNILVSH